MAVERQVPPEEEALVKRLVGELDKRQEDDDWADFVKVISENRKYAAGTQHDDGERGLVRTNVIHSVMAAMVPTVYARDPEIAIVPRESVSQDRYEMLKQFGCTAEAVLRSQLAPDQGALKKKAKSTVRSTMTTGLGWVKVIYQKDYQQDPLMTNRISDAQDNIARLNAKIKAAEESDGRTKDLEAERSQLMEIVKGLEANPEVVRAEGIVIDRPLTEHVIWPASLRDPDKLANAPWLCHVIWMTEDKCTELFDYVPSKATRYEYNKKEREENNPSDPGLVKVYEMWHKDDGRVYTMLAGYKGFIRQPYTPTKVGERFHCLFPLYFNPVDGQCIPLADITLLRELQDEYNTTRTNFATHRKHSIPHWVGLAGSINKDDARKIQNAESMEIVLIDGDPTQPIRSYLDTFANPPIDPLLYDVASIRQDIEFTMGQGDAARGAVANPKTATEAQILQQGLSIRVSERQDIIEDWIEEIARYVLETCLQEMTKQQVALIAGEEAQWPELSKEDVYNMVQIEVKAGTSGKPDKNQEREQWLQMLPELRETLMKIAELRSGGQEEQANILYKLTEETLRRFDEKIDMDSFFPQEEEQKQEEEQRKMAAQQQQQMQAMIQMRQILAEINNTNADTIKKLAEAEAAEEGQQMQSYVSQMQALESLLTTAMSGQERIQ